MASEAAAPYAAKKAGKGKANVQSESSLQRPVADADFKKVADKIFSERKELLHKLAQ